MNVWAIADLHLSFARPERRERYAARWRDHAAKIGVEWEKVVQPGDLVLLPGDVSMARNHREVQPDLAWLEALPGTKVLAPGNHDTWWNGADRVRPLLRRSLLAVGGNALEVNGVVVCGAKGIAPVRDDQAPQEKAAMNHELSELDRSLEQAARIRTGREQPLYLLWHYPPFDGYGRPGPCVERSEKANVSVCVYGHLHMQGQWSRAVQGKLRGVRYYCVAADAVGFRPFRIDVR